MATGFPTSVRTTRVRARCVNCSRVFVWTLLALAGASQGASGNEDFDVIVQLRSGRIVQGTVNRQTTLHELGIHSSEPSIILESRHPWDSILSIENSGHFWNPNEFRAHVLGLELPSPASEKSLSGVQNPEMETLVTQTAHTIANTDLPPAEGDNVVPQAIAPPGEFVPLSVPVAIPPTFPPALPPVMGRVRSIAVESQLANWDADPEPDGLRVILRPLDVWGEVVPVNGTFEAQLIGEWMNIPGRRSRWRRGRVTRDVETRGRVFPEIARWSIPIRWNEFGPNGTVVELPFRGGDPSIDLDLAPYGILAARFGVPSQGQFEATDDQVVLRPSSPLREQFQQFSGGWDQGRASGILQQHRRFHGSSWRYLLSE